jgi:hypothetical protein
MMSEEQINHLATPQDFKLAQDLDRKVHRVVLPKLGKAVLMRRPSPLWFIFRGQLPASLAAKVAHTNASAPQNPPLKAPEDFQHLARWIVELLEEIMVQPRVSLSPGPGEIPPDLIPDEDLNFMIRWAMGEVASDGGEASAEGDLARFRGD